MGRFLFFLVLSPLAAWCQKPIIFQAGVVNAASYEAGSLQSGSLASIFGSNLAASLVSANGVPLPVQLSGTSVTVDGVAAPLIYVSPGQIDFQIPALTNSPSGPKVVVVTTPSGVTDPYVTGSLESFGIFTVDSSGCGRGAVLNVKADGTVSINSPSNSVSPGDYISLYGTGLYVPGSPADGTPTPSSPLRPAGDGGGTVFDFTPVGASSVWAGLAPGLIGVDQINDQVPVTVREGCAVPLQMSGSTISPPVTISVRKGGGQCVDPPSAGFGQVTWEKTITTVAAGSSSESDAMTVSLQTSPGKQRPQPISYVDSSAEYNSVTFFGSSCPVPGYRSLGAGSIAAQGPDFGPIAAAALPLPNTQVTGLVEYQAPLPAGAIRTGTFAVVAAGGADVGAFQSIVQIGSGIQITTPLAGAAIPTNQPLTVNWTGGDSNTWVTMRLVNHLGNLDQVHSVQARASDGTLKFFTAFLNSGLPGLEIIVEVTPDPSQIPAFSAPGLSLGGQQTWKYTYRFEGARIVSVGPPPL